MMYENPYGGQRNDLPPITQAGSGVKISTGERRGPWNGGYDGECTEGCKPIKAKGGTTFAKDISAEVNGMPLSAQAQGCIDFVLPLDKIATKLVKIGTRVAQD
jgi:hypothetical protein